MVVMKKYSFTEFHEVLRGKRKGCHKWCMVWWVGYIFVLIKFDVGWRMFLKTLTSLAFSGVCHFQCSRMLTNMVDLFEKS